ncbi:MAG: phosphoesterase [Rhodospirillaceae bacterium]|nr:MAG: phosphoesterase [Rhodospirillaceae bacterium]
MRCTQAMRRFSRRGIALTFMALMFGLPGAAASAGSNDGKTTTPIKHVIIIIAENRTFDHLFATYQPKPGETISNLLSKGIVDANGMPGPHFADAAQYRASDTSTYDLSPGGKTPYTTLPPPTTGTAHEQASDTRPSPFATIETAAKVENGLLISDMALLTTGATGLPERSADTRIAGVRTLANGPFQLTHGLKDDDYAGSPVHRFYQMWQQFDCAVAHASPTNPSGCLADLFPWVEVTVGTGSNGKSIPPGFSDTTTGEGATAMGFYNMAVGDVPYLKQLADEYTISDNFHQPIQGGSGVNHMVLGNGLPLYYSDGHGHMATPPADQIENPDPQPGTNNFYIQDGYTGGSYSACADPAQPGVKAVRDYLASLPYKPDPKCATGAYYLLNNYAPGYLGDGTVSDKPFTFPPSAERTIGDELNARDISWRYYGSGWDAYIKNPSIRLYCPICNPFQYATSIMTDAGQRHTHLKDIPDFDDDVKSGHLPAVSFVKPDALADGHPASSKLDIFEAFARRLIGEVQASPKLWATTAILIIFDEGGGYWDSGYVQPLDFFGDGTRVPAIMVSPYSRGGRVSHVYADHVSFLKFVEHNWKLRPVTSAGRDNLPNPVARPDNPYVPVNSPAIGDLMDMFAFKH